MFVLTALFALSVPAVAGPGDSPRPAFGASLELSEAEEARILEAVAERDPDQAKRLKMLKTRDSGRYYEMLRRVARGLERERTDPETAARHERIQSVRHEIKALAIEHRQADEAEQKRLRKQMDKLASEIFDLRQEERRARLVELRERLEQAEAEVEEQDANRDAVIAEHLDKLLEFSGR